jgi:hypothetical protein
VAPENRDAVHFVSNLLSLKFVEQRSVATRSPSRKENAHAPTRSTDSADDGDRRRTQMLEGWARRAKTAQATALRARLILGCAAGKPNTAVARELRVTKQTVGKWRSRFVTGRLEGCSMSRGRGRRARSRMRPWSAW